MSERSNLPFCGVWEEIEVGERDVPQLKKHLDASTPEGKKEFRIWEIIKKIGDESDTREVGLPQVLEISNEGDEHFVIVRKYSSGSLTDFIHNKPSNKSKKWRCKLRVSLLISCARAIEILHKNGIFHNDIAPKNIMLGREKLVLVDYDSSTFAKQTSADDRFLKNDLQSFGFVIYNFIEKKSWGGSKGLNAWQNKANTGQFFSQRLYELVNTLVFDESYYTSASEIVKELT
eukprot:509762_1